MAVSWQLVMVKVSFSGALYHFLPPTTTPTTPPTTKQEHRVHVGVQYVAGSRIKNSYSYNSKRLERGVARTLPADLLVLRWEDIMPEGQVTQTHLPYKGLFSKQLWSLLVFFTEMEIICRYTNVRNRYRHRSIMTFAL